MGFDTTLSRAHGARHLTLEHVLGLTAFHKLNQGARLDAADRLALLIYAALTLILAFTAFSIILNPRSRRKREDEIRSGARDPPKSCLRCDVLDK
jgi:hypothetical protein